MSRARSARPYYRCQDCGAFFLAQRKPRSDKPVRCPTCTDKARCATKRATWHRHKARYRPDALA